MYYMPLMEVHTEHGRADGIKVVIDFLDVNASFCSQLDLVFELNPLTARMGGN